MNKLSIWIKLKFMKDWNIGSYKGLRESTLFPCISVLSCQ